VKVLDKTKSYKIRGGKLVERTAEEQAELQRRKAEAASPPRMPKSKEPFVKLTIPQLNKLFGLRSPASVFIFMVMLHENFRHRGKPFILPADKLAAHGGFSHRTQRRALLQLEACGLVSVRRGNRKSPEIAVL
jgi:hypothetical protein